MCRIQGGLWFIFCYLLTQEVITATSEKLRCHKLTDRWQMDLVVTFLIYVRWHVELQWEFSTCRRQNSVGVILTGALARQLRNRFISGRGNSPPLSMQTESGAHPLPLVLGKVAFFFLINLLHIIYTRCTKISYKIVPATSFTSQVLINKWKRIV